MAEKKVPYQVNGRSFEGAIVYDDSVKTKAPGDFRSTRLEGRVRRHHRAGEGRGGQGLRHAGGGHVRQGLRRPAEDARAARGRHEGRAQRPALHHRLRRAAYDALLTEADKLGLVDTSKKAAIGFCAGGGFVLEQARAGADFKATVVFHVTNPNPVVPGTPCNIKGRVMAVHGRADPVTPKPMMDALEEELTKAKVDWHIVTFGRGVHSFCDPTANHLPSALYDEKLCRTSYMLMRDFFAETL